MGLSPISILLLFLLSVLGIYDPHPPTGPNHYVES